MRLTARLIAIALVPIALYWLVVNAWAFFSFAPTMAAFDGESMAGSDQVIGFLVYGALPATVVLALSIWIWRATRRPRRVFRAKPS